MANKNIFYEVLASDEEADLLVCTAHTESEARELTKKWIEAFDPDCIDYMEFAICWRKIGAIGTENDCCGEYILFDPQINEGVDK